MYDCVPLIIFTYISSQVGSPNWMGRMPLSQEEAIGLSRSELHPETLKPYPPLNSATATVASTRPPPRRTSRRPVPNKTRPVPRPRHQVRKLNKAQWTHLLNTHGIYVDVPQVCAHFCTPD